MSEREETALQWWSWSTSAGSTRPARQETHWPSPNREAIQDLQLVPQLLIGGTLAAHPLQRMGLGSSIHERQQQSHEAASAALLSLESDSLR